MHRCTKLTLKKKNFFMILFKKLIWSSRIPSLMNNMFFLILNANTNVNWEIIVEVYKNSVQLRILENIIKSAIKFTVAECRLGSGGGRTPGNSESWNNDARSGSPTLCVLICLQTIKKCLRLFNFIDWSTVKFLQMKKKRKKNKRNFLTFNHYCFITEANFRQVYFFMNYSR